MKKYAFLLLAFGTLAFSSASLMACLWDSDTLAAESARFPGISQLITGAFPRHSQDFYAWRRKTCEQQLAKNPALFALYDDLAVAQHKLGDHNSAIATMLAKERLRPGIYETYSNLGTFCIYTGEFEEAVKWISKALAINPNAHFGREKYQRWLVQWIIEDNKPVTRTSEHEEQKSLSPAYLLLGFARFVASKEAGMETSSFSPNLTLSPEHALAAIRGVAGMMRFADFDNPLLQEAMGDLLLSGEQEKNAAQLASICYLHAARETSDEHRKSILVNKFKMSGHFTPDFDQEKMERRLFDGLKQGDAYFQAIREDEIAWISAGLDASAEFQKKYLAAR